MKGLVSFNLFVINVTVFIFIFIIYDLFWSKWFGITCFNASALVYSTIIYMFQYLLMAEVM